MCNNTCDNTREFYQNLGYTKYFFTVNWIHGTVHGRHMFPGDVTVTCTSKTNRLRTRNAKIPAAKSPGRLNFVRWRLIFVGPKYGNCLN